MSMSMHRRLLCFLGAVAFAAVGRAFDLERPERPGDGASVPGRFEFFIAAEGEWERADRYKIELSDDGFDTVLRAFDGSQDRKGWAVASLPQDEEVGTFAEHRGVYFRPSDSLPDGTYRWRAFKYDGTGFRRIGQEQSFRVDTVPPGPVAGVRVEMRDDGRLVILWDPVFEDEKGAPELVAGYRVYRYLDRRTARNRPTYLVGETESTRLLLSPRYDDAEARILYFSVMAVDQAGNEPNRAIPHRLGELDSPDPALVR